MTDRSTPTLLVISQVYVPDPAAVGQIVHDACADLSRRQLRVVVLTSQRGYEDPAQKYPGRERLDGVDVIRLPLSSFGKGSIPRRLFGATLFLLQVILRAVFMRRLDGILVSTSPPMCSLAAVIVAAIRRTPIVYWAMDINPDQAIALKKFRRGSLPVRLLEALNRSVLRRASRIVALDSFMADRLRKKTAVDGRLAVIPLWAPGKSFDPVEHADNPFRGVHGLEGKFVFMYSGNMSPAHPLDTILQAALRLRDRRDVAFVFIGGGLAKQKVELFAAHERLDNVLVLPYQPLDRIRYSLSAADVHLVAMGDDMVGIVHPSKIYGAMACGRPILLVGPRKSHAGELLVRYRIGWCGEHGDPDGLVATIQGILDTPREELRAMGRRSRRATRGDLSKETLCQAFCDEVEGALAQSQFFARPANDGDRVVEAASDRGQARELAPAEINEEGAESSAGEPGAKDIAVPERS